MFLETHVRLYIPCYYSYFLHSQADRYVSTLWYNMLYMERQSHPEEMSLGDRFLALENHLQTSANPTVQDLDAYFAIGVQLYQQEAQKGDEEWVAQVRVREFQALQRGSYGNEKRKYCLERERHRRFSVRMSRRLGQPSITPDDQKAANNWKKLARACRMQAIRNFFRRM